MAQLSFPTSPPPRFDRASFVVSDSNNDAYVYIGKQVQWSAPLLCIYGPKGCGKTHLGQIWADEHNAEKLSGAGLSLRQALALDEQALPVLIDNADVISGQREQQEALLHIYNRARERHLPILLLAPTPPAAWNLALADLRSRLLAAPAVAIRAPNDALLAAIIRKQAYDRGLILEEAVIDFLLNNAERDSNNLAQILSALDGEAMATGRKISVSTVRKLLAKADDKAEF